MISNPPGRLAGVFMALSHRLESNVLVVAVRTAVGIAAGKAK